MSNAALDRLGQANAETAIVLGSGLNALVAQADADSVSYSEFAELPKPSVPGHAGRFVPGAIGKTPVIFAQGRVHLYEGHSARDVTAGVRILAAAGIKRLILTNAAGVANRGFSPGSWMMISDHLNLTGTTPLLGAPFDASGAVRLVGTGSSATLPPPLGGAALALELACVHTPPPDLDQFAPAPRLTKIRGAITAKKVKMTMTLESELSMTVDPAGVPTILRLQDGGGAALLEQVMPLQPGSRGRFASSGGELKIMPGKGRGVRTQKIVLKESPGPTAALASGSGTMAIETGGLMARRSVKLTANGKGSRLAVREQ